MSDQNPRQRAWVEVSPAAIKANAGALCQHLTPGTELMAVVKADGYGHGAVTVANAALDGGAVQSWRGHASGRIRAQTGRPRSPNPSPQQSLRPRRPADLPGVAAHAHPQQPY
jgi:hypothetical protein